MGKRNVNPYGGSAPGQTPNVTPGWSPYIPDYAAIYEKSSRASYHLEKQGSISWTDAEALWDWCYKELQKWIDSYGKATPNQAANVRLFKAKWKKWRNLLPLQLRIVVEQILWDKGSPWRSLITGFKPLD